MAFNNRNRSLLSLVHHTERDLLYLLDLMLQRCAVDVIDRGRDVRQHGQAARSHLGESAKHDELALLASGRDGHDAGADQRDQRRMAGQHAEVALGAGHIDLIDLAGKRDLLRRHEFEVERGHA